MVTPALKATEFLTYGLDDMLRKCILDCWRNNVCSLPYSLFIAILMESFLTYKCAAEVNIKELIQISKSTPQAVQIQQEVVW